MTSVRSVIADNAHLTSKLHTIQPSTADTI